ncbi:transposable element Tcb1 transposase [Trichonephila clavipes]|nr:transposable element Tcb1 transposase [Trichonephila clavipes]
MDWPAYSPDLNPIEHVWDMLGRRIADHQPPPTCLPELRRALLDEWCNIPLDQIDNLILSMPRRSSFLCNATDVYRNYLVYYSGLRDVPAGITVKKHSRFYRNSELYWEALHRLMAARPKSGVG